MKAAAVVVGFTLSLSALAAPCPSVDPRARAPELSRRGRELFRDGKVRDALCTLTAATRKDASDVDAWFWLASAAIEVGFVQRAEDAIQHAVRLAPERGDVWILSGFIAHERGQLEEARARYQRYLENHPETPQAEELRWVLAQLSS